MKQAARVGLVLFLAGATAFAQRPSDPALLVPQTAPELDYVAVPNPITLPAGTTMGRPPAWRSTPKATCSC